MKWGSVAAGALLAALAAVLLWGTGLVAPPEGLTRKIAAVSALYPGSIGGADIERIPCPPLAHLRLYVVCTQECSETWMIVGVRGLVPENLANLGRVPAQPAGESRKKINAAVAAEGLRLDVDGAREMIGCYMRLEGLLPQLVLTPATLFALESTGGDEDEMLRLGDSLDEPDALQRIDPERTLDGFRAALIYWDASSPGRPVIEMEFDLDEDGVLRSLVARPSQRDLPAPDAGSGAEEPISCSGSGSTRDTRRS